MLGASILSLSLILIFDFGGVVCSVLYIYYSNLNEWYYFVLTIHHRWYPPTFVLVLSIFQSYFFTMSRCDYNNVLGMVIFNSFLVLNIIKLISYQTIYIHSCSLRLSVTYESVQVIHRCSVVSYHHMILVSLQLVRHDKNDHLIKMMLV